MTTDQPNDQPTPPTYGQQPGYPMPPGYGTAPGYGQQPGTGQQPGYGAPAGYGAAPGYGAPVPPKKKTLKIVLIIVGIVLVLCLVGGGIGGYAIYKAYKSTAGPAQDTTNSFFNDLQTTNYPAAYGLLCASTRDSMTEEQFTATMTAQDPITAHRITGTSVSDVNGVQSATIIVNLTQGGHTVRHSVPLTRENGDWLVCGQPY